MTNRRNIHTDLIKVKHIETQYNKYTTEMLKLGFKPSFNISVVYLLYCVSMCFQILERILNSINIEKASAKIVGHLGGEWSQIQ